MISYKSTVNMNAVRHVKYAGYSYLIDNNLRIDGIKGVINQMQSLFPELNHGMNLYQKEDTLYMEIPSNIYIENNPSKGFKWSAIAQYGVVEISYEELLARPEFEGMTNGRKIIYANELGWKWNVDKGVWHRLRGH